MRESLVNDATDFTCVTVIRAARLSDMDPGFGDSIFPLYSVNRRKAQYYFGFKQFSLV